jgi:hypothetical protein
MIAARLLLFLFGATISSVASAETCAIVLTGLENEPKDARSLVPFLESSTQKDPEGLVATISIHLRDCVPPLDS